MIANKEDFWVAISLEFGLSAQANSENEAKCKLHEQIKEYIDEAINEDKAFQNKLLNRKGSTSWFILYYYTLLKTSIMHKNGNIIFSENTHDYLSHA
jgi:predicted RNase H-like HicB family nuclease